MGTPWNCLHSSATNANFFTIRAQGLGSTYPNQLALQCETQFSFDRTGKFHTTYILRMEDPFPFIEPTFISILLNPATLVLPVIPTWGKHSKSGSANWKDMFFPDIYQWLLISIWHIAECKCVFSPFVVVFIKSSKSQFLSISLGMLSWLVNITSWKAWFIFPCCFKMKWLVEPRLKWQNINYLYARHHTTLPLCCCFQVPQRIM